MGQLETAATLRRAGGAESISSTTATEIGRKRDLFELLADDETVEQLIHPHLGGANVVTAVFDPLFNRVDLAVDLDLAVFEIDMEHPAGGKDRGPQDQSEDGG
jgi:hypothetical protein